MPKKITEAGLLTGLALLLSYIESLFPFQAGIPGFKLGLANLVIVIALYFLKPGEVFPLQDSALPAALPTIWLNWQRPPSC